MRPISVNVYQQMKKTAVTMLLWTLLLSAVPFSKCMAASASAQGWTTVKNRTYFYRHGQTLNGLQKIGNYTYYFTKAGYLKKSCWVTMGKVKRYFDEKGRMTKKKNLALIEDATRKKARDIAGRWVKRAIAHDKGKHSKLRACYNYMKRCYYKPTSISPSASDKYNGWDAKAAYNMYMEWSGNCYSYSSAFAFMAQELGYDAKLVVGTATTAQGGNNTHCWVEINGKIYDPEREDSPFHPVGCFGKTYSKAPYRYRKQFSV